MKVIYLCFIALLLTFFLAVSAQQPRILIDKNEFANTQLQVGEAGGIQTSISMASVTALANKILPVIFAKAKATNIPNVDEGHYHVKNISINELGMDALTLSTNNVDRIQFRLSRFFTSVSCRAQYHPKLYSISANVSARISDSYLNIDILLKNVNGRLAIEFQNVGFSAGTASVHFSGNIIVKLVNAVKSLFNNKIRHAIVNGVSTGLKSGLLSLSQSIAAGIQLRAPIQTWGSLDLGLKRISYANNAITVGFSGDVQNTAQQPSTSIARHDVSIGVPGTHTFKIALDTFVFNTMFNTYFYTLQFTRSLTQYYPGTMPSSVSFYTDKWAQHFPQLQQQYAGQSITFQFELKSSPVLSTTGGIVKIDAVTQLTMIINGFAVATFDLKMSSGATVQIDVKTGSSGKIYTIIPQLQQATFTFSNTQTIVGPVDMNKINAILNIISNGVVVPLLNTMMISGIPVNSFLGNSGLILNNPQFVFPNGGILIAFSLDYYVPQ